MGKLDPEMTQAKSEPTILPESDAAICWGPENGWYVHLPIKYKDADELPNEITVLSLFLMKIMSDEEFIKDLMDWGDEHLKQIEEKEKSSAEDKALSS